MRNLIHKYGHLANKYIGLILFFSFLTVAIFSFDEYGISWDEPRSRTNGEVSYNYVFGNDTELLTYKDRDYGIAIELPLYIIEKGLKIEDSRSIYIMRHFVTHLFFLIGAYFFFLLIKYIHKNNLLAAIGFLILVLHPRIYSHSFFNSKDIPFMCMFIISLYYMIKSFDKPSILNLLKLSITIALLLNIRLMGIIIPACFLVVTMYDGIINKTHDKWYRSILIVLSFSSIILYTSWPYLWINPIDNFVVAFENMSKFRWGNIVMFNGESIKVSEIGWTYIPTWFLITIPSIHLLLAVTGIASLVYSFFGSIGKFFRNSFERNNLLFFVFFLVPVLIVILLKSVLYDSWRQLFFIYPPFIMVILYGINQVKSINAKLYKATIAIAFASLIFLGVESASNFPNQHVYFNEFVSKNEPELVRNNFEQDYWGVSSKQAIEYVLKNDSSEKVRFCFTNKPGYNNVLIIKKEDRERIQIGNSEQSTYLVTNFRWHQNDYKDLNHLDFFTIKRNNSTIAQVFKLK